MGCRDIAFTILLTFVKLVISLQNCKLYITFSMTSSFCEVENGIHFLWSLGIFL